MSDAQPKINALWNSAAETYDETPRHGISDQLYLAHEGGLLTLFGDNDLT